MSRVSVIIPCYNQAHYAGEAVASVLAQTFADYEIIVVDDGSTDPRTNALLDPLAGPRVRIIHTGNQGQASACNNGIRESSGEYILPLDADDRIAPSYMEQAVRVLDADANVGIVYCEAEFFGDKTGKWELPPYTFPNILLGNMIFSAAFYRRADWQRVNGYNPNMNHLLQDHDLWLSLIELGRSVYRIPETLFFYRQRAGSMINTFTREQIIKSRTQLFNNHAALYSANIGYVFEHMQKLREEADYFRARTEELQRRLDSFEGNPEKHAEP